MTPSEDEISLGDDEFGVPEDPVEQERFKRRLMATARSLKRKQQQLQADQDLLIDRWTEVLAAEEYALEHHTADRPPRGRDKMAYQPEYPDRTPTPIHYGPGQQAGPARYFGKQSRITKIDVRIARMCPSARR